MAVKFEVVGTWETNYVLKDVNDESFYMVPSYEKDWLEIFLHQKIELLDYYHNILYKEREIRILPDVINIKQYRLLLWREIRATFDGVLRQCDRVIEGVDLMGSSDYSSGYSFSQRSAHMDTIALFCLLQMGIELLILFDKECGYIRNIVEHGGSMVVLNIINKWFSDRGSSIKLIKCIRNALCHADDLFLGKLKDAKKVAENFGGNLYRARWLTVLNDEIFVGVSPLLIRREDCESDDEYDDLISKSLSNNFSIKELRSLLRKCGQVMNYTELDFDFKKRLGL